MDASSEPVAASEPIPRDRASRLAGLYESHATGALRLAFLLTGDRGCAEDLVHDAFVRMISRFRHKDDPQNFNAYLKRTVINLATSRRRRAALESRFKESQRFDTPLSVSLPDVEQHQVLLGALAKLSYQQRVVVVLRIYEDQSEKDVSRLLKISPAATRSLLHRAIAALRQQMQEVEHD